MSEVCLWIVHFKFEEYNFNVKLEFQRLESYLDKTKTLVWFAQKMLAFEYLYFQLHWSPQVDLEALWWNNARLMICLSVRFALGRNLGWSLQVPGGRVPEALRRSLTIPKSRLISAIRWKRQFFTPQDTNYKSEGVVLFDFRKDFSKGSRGNSFWRINKM